MEENKNDIEEIDGVQEERGEFPPFFGLFRMTRFERVLHASIIGLIGAAFIAYTLWSKIIPGQNPTKEMLQMNDWYVIPCFVLSVLLLLSGFPVVMKDRSFGNMMLQQLLRCFMAIIWMVLYFEASQILFIIFYRHLPA